MSQKGRKLRYIDNIPAMHPIPRRPDGCTGDLDCDHCWDLMSPPGSALGAPRTVATIRIGGAR